MATLKVVSSLVLLTASAFALKGAVGGGGDTPLDPPPPVNTEFAGVLLRIGLPADALACAGVGSGQVAGLVAAVEAQYSAEQLATLDRAFIEAKATRDKLVRKVRSGLASEAEVVSLRQAETSFNNAETARKNHLEALLNAGLGSVSAEQAAIVRRIQKNRSWGLSTELLVRDRSEPDWVALRAAVATERIAAEDEQETCPQSTQTFLAQVRGESDIAAAKVNLDTSLASVQTAWNAAASD
jgi:hypothetical protein